MRPEPSEHPEIIPPRETARHIRDVVFFLLASLAVEHGKLLFPRGVPRHTEVALFVADWAFVAGIVANGLVILDRALETASRIKIWKRIRPVTGIALVILGLVSFGWPLVILCVIVGFWLSLRSRNRGQWPRWLDWLFSLFILVPALGSTLVGQRESYMPFPFEVIGFRAKAVAVPVRMLFLSDVALVVTGLALLSTLVIYFGMRAGRQ